MSHLKIETPTRKKNKNELNDRLNVLWLFKKG